MKNYHYILGLDKSATIADIKSAYRKLSKKFHPDLNEGDKFFEDRFKEINEAYEYLIKNYANQTYSEDIRNRKSGELPKIVLFKTDKSEIFNKGKIEVSWSTINAEKIFIDLIGNVKSSGSSNVTINGKDDHFILNITAENQYGKASDQIKISIKNKTAIYKQSKYRIYLVAFFLLLVALPSLFIYSSYIKMQEDAPRKEMELKLLYQDLQNIDALPKDLPLGGFKRILIDPVERDYFFKQLRIQKLIDESLDLETFTQRTGLTPKPKGFWENLLAASEYSLQRLKIMWNSEGENLKTPILK